MQEQHGPIEGRWAVLFLNIDHYFRQINQFDPDSLEGKRQKKGKTSKRIGHRPPAQKRRKSFFVTTFKENSC